MKFRSIYILLFLYLLASYKTVLAEGSTQLVPLSKRPDASGGLYLSHFNDPTQQNSYSKFGQLNADTSYRLMFTVNSLNEKVYFGLNCVDVTSTNQSTYLYYIRKPNGVLMGPFPFPITGNTGYIASYTKADYGPNTINPSGYVPITVDPASMGGIGNYSIEFTFPSTEQSMIIQYFDITVAEPSGSSYQPIPGRVWSRSWQVNIDFSTRSFYGSFYIYSDEHIITKFEADAMKTGTFSIYSNKTGCGNTGNWVNDRKSVSYRVDALPKYKIFINEPDAIYPIGELGKILSATQQLPASCDGSVIFNVVVDKPGMITLRLDCPPLGSDAGEDITFNRDVIANVNNQINWNGSNNFGDTIGNGRNIIVDIDYLNSLTNLPLYDVEGNDKGFKVDVVSPPPNPMPPDGTKLKIFWDDTNLSTWGGYNNSTNGCLYPANPPAVTGCHNWTFASSNGGASANLGNWHTVNSWWYYLSQGTVPISVVINRNPGDALAITGPGQVCQGLSATYTVPAIPSATGYVWALPDGSSQTTSTNQITLTFPVVVTGNLSVHGTNAQCDPGAESPLKSIEVFATPTPTLSGNGNVCVGSTGNIYTTQPGMTDYIWTVSAGGTITNGGTSGSNTVTVTWTTTGSKTVSVKYSGPQPLYCSSGIAAIVNVVVNPLPVPVISGLSTACVNLPGNVYSTANSMTAYVWTVPAEGIITAGGNSTSNSVTITWTTTGVKTIKVNYTNALGCTASSAAEFQVTVNDVSVPTLAGPSSVCLNSTGNTYKTESGFANYSWTVSSGGTITAGGTGTSDSVTVTWTTIGVKTVSVNYSGPNSCAAGTPTIKSITVNPLPTPTISGTSSVCEGAAGNIYSTQAGQASYIWSVSAGGTITAGGTSTSNTVTVTWNAAGSKTVSVNYSSVNGCAAISPFVYIVTVNSLPVPSVSGPASVCANTTGNIYTTQAGFSNYTWSISTGGTITSGAGTNSISVSWTTPGSRNVSVNYSNSFGCAAVAATVYPVTVNSLAAPTIEGPSSVCANSANSVYTTEIGNINYAWSYSAGGTLISGGTSTSNTITIMWNTPGAKTVSVNYTNASACAASSATVFNVTVNPLPTPTISGATVLCANTSNVSYTTQAGNTNYSWVVSSGGIITSGNGTSSILVKWNTAGAQNVSVNYTNSSQCSAVSPTVYNVTVNPLPVPVITGPTYVCNNTDNNYITQPGNNTYTWNVSTGGTITSGGSGNDFTNVTWIATGIKAISVNYKNSFNCSAIAPYVLSVQVSPEPSVSAGTGSTICASNTYTLNGSKQFCDSIRWTTSGNGIFSNPTIVNPVYTPGTNDITLGTVSLKLTGYGSAACSGNIVEKTILLKIDPMPTADAGPDGNYCVNAPVFVGGADTTHATVLLWSAGDGVFNNRAILEPTYLPGNIDFANDSVVLTLKVKGTLTCSNKYVSDSRIFRITPYPSINAGPDDYICSKETQFQLMGLGTNYLPENVRWSLTGGDGMLNDSTLIRPVYYTGALDSTTVDRTILFNLRLHGIGYCSDVTLNDQVELKIDPRPVSNAGVDDNTCGQRPYQLSATAQYHSAIQWITRGDGSFSNRTILNPTYTPGPLDVSSNVKLILGLVGCSGLVGSDSLLLTVHPDPSATISGSTTECEGVPVPLRFDFAGSPPWNVTYTNGVSPVTVNGILNSPAVFYESPDVSTLFWIQTSNDKYCNTPADSVHGIAYIEINQLPDLFSVTASNNGFYCEGDTGIAIGINNSQVGMTYELLRNGISTGISLNGTGNPLQFGIFSDIGRYEVQGTNPTGNCQAMMGDTVTVVMNPTPVTDFKTNSACSGDSTFFTVFGDFIDQVSTWQWNFADGTSELYNTPVSPVHVFPTYGIYNVTLNVIDTNGCHYTVSHPVEVIPLPTAFFSYETPNCLNNDTKFKDLSSNPLGFGYIKKWIWTFGDGSPSDTISFPDNPDVVHKYDTSGAYTVILTLINSKGCMVQGHSVVAVSIPPLAAFTFWSHCQNQVATF
ncbi:MAG: PKD domain-containing protein, partial [Bacteroidota bacterium]